MGTITDLLQRSRDDQAASDELYRILYDSLRERAHYWLRRERAGAGLGTTELVHEAYLKLIRGQSLDWRNRDHFFGVATRAMRQVLVEEARKRDAKKRGGGNATHFPLEEAQALSEETASEVLAVEEYLRELSGGVSSLDARIVSLHYFGGLSFPEIAGLLEREDGVPRSAEEVARRWEYVRALLYQRQRKRRGQP